MSGGSETERRAEEVLGVLLFSGELCDETGR
jgi:hypothetical protein